MERIKRKKDLVQVHTKKGGDCMKSRGSSWNPEKAGHYAFLAGVFLALLLGLFPNIVGEYQAYSAFALVVLGLIVGFLNVTSQESTPFLVAAIALGMGSGIVSLNFVPYFGGFLSRVFTYVSVFVAPAALVVAVKAIYNMAESK